MVGPVGHRRTWSRSQKRAATEHPGKRHRPSRERTSAASCFLGRYDAVPGELADATVEPADARGERCGCGRAMPPSRSAPVRGWHRANRTFRLAPRSSASQARRTSIGSPANGPKASTRSSAPDSCGADRAELHGRSSPSASRWVAARGSSPAPPCWRGAASGGRAGAAAPSLPAGSAGFAGLAGFAGVVGLAGLVGSVSSAVVITTVTSMFAFPVTRSIRALPRACSRRSHDPSATYCRANASTAAHPNAACSEGNDPDQRSTPGSSAHRRNPPSARARTARWRSRSGLTLANARRHRRRNTDAHSRPNHSSSPTTTARATSGGASSSSSASTAAAYPSRRPSRIAACTPANPDGAARVSSASAPSASASASCVSGTSEPSPSSLATASGPSATWAAVDCPAAANLAANTTRRCA